MKGNFSCGSRYFHLLIDINVMVIACVDNLVSCVLNRAQNAKDILDRLAECIGDYLINWLGTCQ